MDSGAVSANAWHTVIAWHNAANDTINIQVDNGTVNTVAFSTGTTDTAYPLAIGAFPNGSYELDGRIDEVAIYKRVLTPEERAWLYNSGQGRSYAEVTPIAPSALTYTYGDTAHKHAVTAFSGNTYQYDANGNMTQRVIGTDTYLLSYDAENRLTEVTKNSASIASFVYDGDGKRVQSTLNQVTTTFIGNYYEISGSTVTKYYYAGATRIAMRVNGTLSYLFADHLGSTSLTANDQGTKISELRYKAWGEVRYTSGTTPTDYTYTGQYSDSYINLLWYGSRHYDPYLNHFTQPDSIVPDPYDPQSYDRYSYARNNPIRYSDPSGHNYCDQLNNNNLEDCTSGEQRIASITRKNIPSWDQAFIKNVKMKDISRAEAAYNHFTSDPLQFAEYYVNPKNAPLEYDALELFAGYSTLHTTADQLTWNAVAQILGMDAAEALSNAKLHNLEAGLGANNDNTGNDILTAAGVFSAWYKATYPSAEASALNHFLRHPGPWSSVEEYTQAAQNFYAENANLAQPWRLKTGEMGVKITTSEYFGIYTVDGQIVTFGER